MPNILDYITWRGDLDFSQSPFNAVDNLILSELIYLDFSETLKKHGDLPLSALADKYFQEHTGDEALGLIITGDFAPMLRQMAASHRYGAMNVRETVNVYDTSAEIQFSVTLFELDRNTAYIAFRGTDDTLIGWKEDFKMSFLDAVPAQHTALDYVNDVTRRFNYKHLYIGGHSKGGNLAVYSAVHAEDWVKAKILQVYNNDGPGFKQRLVDTDAYKAIAGRIVTLIPQSSVVGMLLEHEESYRVVKSTQRGLLQHNGFSWQVAGPDFVYLSEVDDDSITIDMTVKELLNSLSLEQREAFIDTLFELISVDDHETLMGLRSGGLKTLFTMSKNYSNLDKATKKAIGETMAYFIDRGFRNYLEVKNADQWRQKLQAMRPELLKKRLLKE